MKRNEVIDLLRNAIPERVWFGIPLTGILLLPIGLPLLYVLGILGLQESPRLTQALMIFSVLYGPLVGAATLFLIRHSNVSLRRTDVAQWLARLSIVSPILMLLTLFAFLGRP